jgi:ribosomal protein S18 acetylase RimI-like enzyme
MLEIVGSMNCDDREPVAGIYRKEREGDGMSGIAYRVGKELVVEQVIELYKKSTLGERRPTESREIFGDMIGNADLIISAWDGAQLVGISRTLTDFSYVAYLADLAVHIDYQRKGIGKELIRKTRAELKDSCFITLLAAPLADKYYEKIGFARNPRAWVLNSGKKI